MVLGQWSAVGHQIMNARPACAKRRGIERVESTAVGDAVEIMQAQLLAATPQRLATILGDR